MDKLQNLNIHSMVFKRRGTEFKIWGTKFKWKSVKKKEKTKLKEHNFKINEISAGFFSSKNEFSKKKERISKFGYKKQAYC